VDQTFNVAWICRGCHDLVHVKRTMRVEGNADECLTIWARNDEGVWYVLKQETGVRVYERD
jgi:hypothetical protein